MASIHTPPDEVLVRYLLGELPSVEADALDERSVVDPDFFERLDAIENDLVDSYARGELPADVQERVKRRYLTSEARAEKVRFASALAHRHKRPATVIPMKPRARNAVPWLLPMAATIAVVGLGLWFLPENRDPDNTPATQQASQDPQPAPVPAPAQPSPAPAPIAEPPASTPRQSLFAFTLAAPRRGVEDIPTVKIPADTTDVTVRMQLEIDDFPRYRAVLKDAPSGRAVWRSSTLASERKAASAAVPVTIPARHFEAGRYLLELEGMSAGGTAEPISVYAFRVVP